MTVKPRFLTSVAIIAGLLLLFSARESRAWDFSLGGEDYVLDLTNTFSYTYNFDNDNNDLSDDKFHQVFNTLDVSLSRGNVRLGARFDINLFANTPFDQHCTGAGTDPSFCSSYDGRRFDNHAMVERFFALVALDNLDLTLGDFYVSLGKGLALHMTKVDELAQDTTIQGGLLVLRHGELTATAFAGRFNPLDVDSTTGWKSPWQVEPVAGGRLEYNFLDVVTAGFHGVYFHNHDHDREGSSSDRGDHDAVWGFGIDVPDLAGGMLALSGEFDMQHTVLFGEQIRGVGMEGSLKGIAAYASATLQVGDATLLAEFKYYDDYQLKAPDETFQPYALLYHSPPTLDRQLAELKDNSMVAGGRLRADYNIGEIGPTELLVFANYGYFENWSERDFTGNTIERWRIHSAFGGFELQWMEGSGELEVNSGVRDVSDTISGHHLRRDVHIDFTIEQALASRHSVNLHTIVLIRGEEKEGLNSARETTTWKEVELALTYKWSPHLSAVFTFERQENLLALKGHTDPQNYFSGSIRYFFNSGTYVNLRVGESRPGLKCFNGACRNFPPFAGAELSGVVRF